MAVSRVARRRAMISLTAATGLLQMIEARGGDPDEVLGPLALDRRALCDPHGFIADADFARLLHEAARVTGDDAFGLHFGERYHPKNLGALAYILVNSPTMGVAFENAGRYLRVHNAGAEASFVREEKWAYLRHRLTDVPLDIRRQHEECSLAVALGAIRLMAGSDWSPVEVQFEHSAPADVAELYRVFKAPATFGHEHNALVVESELCERAIPAADARLYPIMQRYLEDALGELPPEDDFLQSVRRTIGESVRHGEPTLTHVARRLAIGGRTLQRRLGEYGVDFKGLVDDTRRRFALRHLADPEITLTEVAYLLGYSEVSAFNRAFKRWTGSTPSDHRRQRVGG
jgi:AraC-like DNA-binding protein